MSCARATTEKLPEHQRPGLGASLEAKKIGHSDQDLGISQGLII